MARRMQQPNRNMALNLVAKPHLPGRIWPALLLAAAGFPGLFAALPGRAEPPPFHHAPSSAAKRGNPYAGQAGATQAGRELYSAHCVACHGRNAEGNGSAPALAHGGVQLATDGEVFWFITRGSNSGAMPSWASLPEQQRWQLVAYLKTLADAPAASIGHGANSATTPVVQTGVAHSRPE